MQAFIPARTIGAAAHTMDCISGHCSTLPTSASSPTAPATSTSTASATITKSFYNEVLIITMTPCSATRT